MGNENIIHSINTVILWFSQATGLRVSSKMTTEILDIALQYYQCFHCSGRGGCDGKRGRLTNAFIVLFEKRTIRS